MPGNEGRIALVTGGSRGIGAAVILALAADGFDIWLNYNSNRAAAENVAAAVSALGRNCTLFGFDVSDHAAVKAALESALKETTPFALINNAGFTKDNIFGLMPKADWDSVLGVHLNGFFNVTRLLVPYMLRKRCGRIINIASLSGQAGNPGQVNYSAAKAGIIGATKALAKEIGKRNILVNAVAPGFIETDMTSALPLEAALPAIPLGRVGKPEEVAACVRFLCSDGASYITGQVIGINGGLYI